MIFSAFTVMFLAGAVFGFFAHAARTRVIIHNALSGHRNVDGPVETTEHLYASLRSAQKTVDDSYKVIYGTGHPKNCNCAYHQIANDTNAEKYTGPGAYHPNYVRTLQIQIDNLQAKNKEQAEEIIKQDFIIHGAPPGHQIERRAAKQRTEEQMVPA